MTVISLHYSHNPKIVVKSKSVSPTREKRNFKVLYATKCWNHMVVDTCIIPHHKPDICCNAMKVIADDDNHKHELFVLCRAIVREGATLEELRAYAYSYHPELRSVKE